MNFNGILSLLRILLPVYGLIIIFVEERHKHHKNNIFLLGVFGLFLLREIVIERLFSIHGSKLFTIYSPFYYAASFIPVFFLIYIVSQYIFEKKKYCLLLNGFSLVVILGLLSFYIFNPNQEYDVSIVIRITRFVTAAMYLFVIIKMNSIYLEGINNFVTRNKMFINLILGAYIFLYVFYYSAKNEFANTMELFILGLLIGIAHFRIREKYEELNHNIENLKFEREIFVNLLQKVGKGLTGETNFGTILELIMDYSVDVLKSKGAVLFLVSPNKKYLTVQHVNGIYPPVTKVERHAFTKEKFLMEKLMSDEIPMGETYIGEVARSGESLLIEDALNDERIIQTAKGLMDIKTLMAVPLMFRNEVIGVAAFCNKEEGGSFTSEEFSLAQTLSEQAAITINNFTLYNELLVKQREEREIEIAGQIQADLLPKDIPEIPGIDVSAYNKPAKGVGGDYYDLINFNNENLCVIMADVAGKGVPAALVMVMIRLTLHQIIKPDLDPYSIVNHLNKFLTKESSQERYATMFYFLINVKTKKLIYTNAGHGPLLLYRKAEDKFQMLDTPGLPVGIDKDQQYEQGDATLTKGDIAMLYTDGITEAMNVKRQEFTVDRIKEIIKDNSEKTTEEMTNIIRNRINEFAGETPQHDDQTLVLLKIA